MALVVGIWLTRRLESPSSLKKGLYFTMQVRQTGFPQKSLNLSKDQKLVLPYQKETALMFLKVVSQLVHLEEELIF
jgi:hypothetical protein